MNTRRLGQARRLPAALLAGAVLAAAILAAASASHAAELFFTLLSRDGSLEESWTQSVPASLYDAPTADTVDVTIDNAVGGLTFLPYITYDLFPFSDGGFSFSPSVTVYGVQLFSGSTSDPVFTPGIYNLHEDGGPRTLMISLIVPEPAAWALMLVGLGGLGAALRARRWRVAATA